MFENFNFEKKKIILPYGNYFIFGQLANEY